MEKELTMADVRKRYPGSDVSKVDNGYRINREHGYIVIDTRGNVIDGCPYSSPFIGGSF